MGAVSTSLMAALQAVTGDSMPAYLRFYLTANATESGTGPYTYTATAGASAVGGSNLVMASGARGHIVGRLDASAATYVGMCWKTANDGAQTYGGNVLWSIYAVGLSSYKIGISGAAGITGNGADAATVPVLGDLLKIERSGTTIGFYVARASTPTTWLTLHTITGGTTAPLFPGIFCNTSGGAISIVGFSGLSQYVPWVLSAVSVTMDGNSLVYGYRNPGPGTTVAQNIVSDASSPLFGSGITVTNSGTNGNTWAQMTGALPTFTASKINVCIAWEGTNSIANGRSGLQAASDATAYIAALKAANPNWRVVLMTALPRQGSLGATYPTVAAFNAEIDAYNAYLLANYKAMGACAICDVRTAGGVWDMGGDYSDASFAACDTRAGGTVWLEGTNQRIHMTDFGDTKIAALIEPVLAYVTLRDS